MDSSARFAIQTEVLEALAAILNMEASQYDANAGLSLAEAGIDSLGLVEAVFTIEERFGISIPFNANDQNRVATAALTSVNQLLDQVVDLVVQKRVNLPQMAGA
jgi:acyl carrier protein